VNAIELCRRARKLGIAIGSPAMRRTLDAIARSGQGWLFTRREVVQRTGSESCANKSLHALKRLGKIHFFQQGVYRLAANWNATQ